MLRPGALTGILDLFNENGVSVEYMYAFSKQLEGKAQMVVKTDSLEKAEALLSNL